MIEHKLDLKRKISADEITTVISAIKVLSTVNFNQIVNAFESGNTIDKVIAGEIVLDDVLKLVGIGIPPVAIAANYLEFAINAEKVALAIYTMSSNAAFVSEVNGKLQYITANTEHKLANNEYVVWGHVFVKDDSNA